MSNINPFLQAHIRESDNRGFSGLNLAQPTLTKGGRTNNNNNNYDNNHGSGGNNFGSNNNNFNSRSIRGVPYDDSNS